MKKILPTVTWTGLTISLIFLPGWGIICGMPHPSKITSGGRIVTDNLVDEGCFVVHGGRVTVETFDEEEEDWEVEDVDEGRTNCNEITDADAAGGDASW